jgi:hypothetical protein
VFQFSSGVAFGPRRNIFISMTPVAKNLFAIFLCGLAGCSSFQQHHATSRLHATLVSPVEISLTWSAAAGAAGYVLEYANDPAKEEYVPLGFFSTSHRRFRHEQLLPHASFFYRVRPYYGPASDPVQVSLPLELTDEDYAARFGQAEDFSWAAPEIIPQTNAVAHASIRTDPAHAAPANLQAELMSPPTVSGVRLTWTDRASDEEGFLLETATEGSTDYSVCAQLDPNVNSFGWILEPPHRKGYFRIRAFYFGPPSNVVMKQTGNKPGAPL